MYIVHKTVNKITQLVLHAVSDKLDLQRAPKIIMYELALVSGLTSLTSQTFLLKKLYVGLVISCDIADGFYDNCFRCSVSSCPVIGCSVPKCCLGSFL